MWRYGTVRLVIVGAPQSELEADGDRRRIRGWRTYAALAVLVALGAWLCVRTVWPAPSHRAAAFYPIPKTLSAHPVGYEGGPGKVARPSYFAPVVTAGRAVTITSILPILAKDSAPAGLFLFLCAPGSGQFVGLDKPDGCTDPAPFHQVAESTDGPWVGLAVTPLSAGTVRINGFKVRYRDHGNHAVTTGEFIQVVAKT